MKKIVSFILLILLGIPLQGAVKLETLPGTHIYSSMFYFYFPVARNYYFYFSEDDHSVQVEVQISRDSLKNEPLTPSIFETDVNFRIQDIPLLKSGKFQLPVTIRCNKKVTFKSVSFSVYRKRNILILRGVMNNLLVSDISDSSYFKKRFNWKYPLYFDLRFAVNP